MMTMTKSEAMSLRSEIMLEGYDLEMAWVEVNDDQVEVYYSQGYESIIIKDKDVHYEVL
jgi:hypothetical protein